MTFYIRMEDDDDHMDGATVLAEDDSITPQTGKAKKAK